MKDSIATLECNCKWNKGMSTAAAAAAVGHHQLTPNNTTTTNNNIYTVIDGDITDLRLNEKINNKPVIVGLKFKGSKAELSHAINTHFAIPNKERIIIC